MQLRSLIRKILLENNDLLYAIAGFKHGDEQVAYSTVFHVTPMSNVSRIKHEGLMANTPGTNEPNAVYFTPDIYGALILCRHLAASKSHKEDYAILIVNTNGIQLFKDPFAVKESGVYSLENISSKRISLKTIVDSDIIKTKSNWSKFWNWWFWKRSEKPDFVRKFNLLPYSK